MRLTDNDLRVLEAVEWASEEWRGLIPHGSRDWTATRRLCAAGLIECVGDGRCMTCERDEPHEAPIYALTDAGVLLLEERGRLVTEALQRCAARGLRRWT